MKRTLISTGLVAAFGLIGNVHAAGPITAAQALVAPTQLFLSGATANAATIRSAVKTAMCGGTAATDSNEWTASGTYSGKFFAIACNSPVTGGNAVFYFSSLGSNFGVNPVLYNGAGAKTPKLNLATCTLLVCSGVTTEAASSTPDVGYSDINAIAFSGPNAPTAAVLSREFNPVFGNFATAYPTLYIAMQADSSANETTVVAPVNGMQFAIMISNTLATALGGTTNSYPLGLSTSQSIATPTIAGLMAGAYNGAQALKALGISDPTPANTTKVAVCTRPATSGTKAWANTFFLGAGAAPKGDNTSSTIGTGGNWSGQQVAYVENLSSGDLRTCMNAASAQGIPAIGISSLEKGQLPSGTTGLTGLTSTNAYAVARIDGVSPDNAATADRINVRNGLYTYLGEATMQNRGDLTGDQQTIVDAIVASLTNSSVCANPGPTTQPDGTSGNATGCETKWTRSADPFARPVVAAGE